MVVFHPGRSHLTSPHLSNPDVTGSAINSSCFYFLQLFSFSPPHIPTTASFFPLNWHFPAPLLSDRPPLPRPPPQALGCLAATAWSVSVLWVASISLHASSYLQKQTFPLTRGHIHVIGCPGWLGLLIFSSWTLWALGWRQRFVLQSDKAGVCVKPGLLF